MRLIEFFNKNFIYEQFAKPKSTSLLISLKKNNLKNFVNALIKSFIF